jgi:hypothetical protein
MSTERTTIEWRQWIHDHVDIHLDEVTLDRRDLLSLLDQLDDARAQVERIFKARDEERDRL